MPGSNFAFMVVSTSRKQKRSLFKIPVVCAGAGEHTKA